MTAWLLLALAGVVEIAWAMSISHTGQYTRPVPTAVFITLSLILGWLLYVSMQSLPVSTAYLAFTSIGGAGIVLLGVVIHHDPLTIGRVGALAVTFTGLVWISRYAH